ncbi:MAG: ABC transporter permease [Bacteroidota bacterium]
MSMLNALGNFGYLIWQVSKSIPHSFKERKRIVYQMDHVGVNSIPLVLVIGFFAGAIIAWQAAYQFRGMISLSVMGGQVTRVVVMEMAPVLTALVISGRIGASMTAEIGTMQVTEQIDALKTLGINPIRYIVLPRVLGLSLMMPILTFFSLFIAVLGAYLVSDYFLDITRQIFLRSIRDFFEVRDLLGGLIKGTLFGLQISLIGCYMGMRTEGGAKGVGDATISSFVISAISILVSDFLLWVILF